MVVRRYRAARCVVAGIIIFGALSAASAQTTPKQEAPKQDSARPASQAYEVSGFRDVHFGMSEAEVRAAATKDFGLKPADFTAAPNAIEGTTVLTARVASLDPGPGPARIAYIFGHASKKLIQVNVAWGEDAKQTVDTIVAAGTRLQRYFAEFAWKKDAARAGIPVGANTVVLFAADDEKKGTLRLILDGVQYQMQGADNKPATSPEPKSPPKLIINYIADRENPDIARIEKGKF
ncbi:MAG: hypothetical protein JO000_31755 [Alphaproteobacteria bacterium]|nr:hypothetical protein [Alphaproteobacteria bacterium]